MAYSYGLTLLILCPLVFLAAFIDSIAGGGGLISLPAYIFAGLPIHTAAGTNKFSSSIGTGAAVANYIRGGCVDFYAAIPGIAGALIGSWIGTRLALSLSPKVLQICLVIILPIAGLLILSDRGVSRRTNINERSLKFKLIFSFVIGLVLGSYDGFFGPGTGMFMTLALSGLVRLELIKAVGTTKVLNFSSNIASMVTWLINGKILFPIAIPCSVCSVAGGFLGSRMAMKTGKKFIRLVLVFVALLLFVKILFNIFQGWRI
jgi:uncharacterized membrane protein YfcA